MLHLSQQQDAEECRLVAATVAARFAQLYVTEASSSSATAAAAASGNAQQAGGCLGDLLPWLVLFGCCCLLWYVQLLWRHKGLVGMPGVPDALQAPPFADSCMSRLHIRSSTDIFFAAGQHSGNSNMFICGSSSGSSSDSSSSSSSKASGQTPLMSALLAAVQAPLQDAGISAQLSALGLDAGALLAKVVAAKAAVDAGSADQPDAVLAAVKDLGEALCCLPFSKACNYAACTTMSGGSEAQLVQGRNHKCSGCNIAR
jgi:hypothetical protein